MTESPLIKVLMPSELFNFDTLGMCFDLILHNTQQSLLLRVRLVLTGHMLAVLLKITQAKQPSMCRQTGMQQNACVLV